MTRSLSYLFCALFSLNSFAGIQIAQWLPWKFVEQKLVPKDFQISFHETMEINAGELKPQIRFRADVNGEVTHYVFTHEGIETSHQLTSHIEIDAISIDQWIERNVNGNIFRVHIKADCSPFRIQVNRMETDSFLDFQEEGILWTPRLKNFAIRIPGWSLSSIQCSGIGGIGEEISNQLKAALTSPQLFQNLLKEVIGEKISQYFYSAWDSIIASAGQELTIRGMDRPSQKGVIVHAELNSAREVDLNLPSEQSLSGENPQLIISKEGFEALLHDGINRMIPKNYNLQEVDGFRKLMSSRTKQFFVWPDLMRFPKNNPFYFSSLPQQSQLSMVKTGDGVYQTWFNSNAVVSTILGGAPIDYLQLGIGLETDLKVSVIDGKLHLRTGRGRITMAWAYGLIYSMIFNPNRRIAHDILMSAMNGMLNDLSTVQELPVIKVDDLELKLQNFKETNNIITMDWL